MLKPNGHLRLNTSSPLTRGLTALYALNSNDFISDSAAPSVRNYVSRNPNIDNLENVTGTGLSFDGNDYTVFGASVKDFIYSGAQTEIEAGYPVSFFVKAKLISGQTSGCGIGYADSTSATNLLAVQVEAGVPRLVSYAGSFNSVSANESVPTDEEFTLVGVMPSSDRTTWTVFLDGEKLTHSGTGTAAFPTFTSGNSRLSIGAASRSSPIMYYGHFYVAGAYNVALTDDEGKALSADPYQLFERVETVQDYASLFSGAASNPWDSFRLGSSTPNAVYVGANLIDGSYFSIGAPVASGTFAPPAGQVGVVYNYNTSLLFTGGEASSYSLDNVTLSDGLSFNTSNGVISGTPTGAVTFTGAATTGTNAIDSDTTNAADIVINAASGTTTEVVINNITWTLDGTVTVGQFVNGDYYAIDTGSGITVMSVSPAPSGNANGTMKNPVPDIGQGFIDVPGDGLDDWEAALYESYPISLSGGDAIVSSISKTTETTDWQGLAIGSNTHVVEAEILTVLSTAPAAGTFRPCPCDRTQNLYNTSQIDTSILPNKSLTGITIPTHSGFSTQLEYLERGIERPWVLFGHDWQSRVIHPSENMSWYHEYIGEYLSELCVFLCGDTAGKTTLINRFIQLGIDYRYSNNSDSSVWAWPMVFAGLLIDEPDLYDYWIDNPTIRTQRGHEKLYYIGDRTTSSSSIITAGETFVDWQAPGGEYVAFAKQVGEEYEHLHPSEWTCYSPHCKAEVYRSQHDVHPLVGLTLSSILVDAKIGAGTDVNAMLAHDPIRDYIDRWMDNPWENENYIPTGRTYRAEMEYYQTFTIYYYNYGSGGSDFIDDMWSAYR